MDSMDYLFQYGTVEKFLADQMAYVKRDLAGATPDRLAREDYEADYVNRHSVELPRLVKENAKLTPSESKEGIEVTVRVPLEGETRLLSNRATDAAPRIYARVTDQRSWAGDSEARITFTETFEAGTSAADIRTWASGQVALVQAELDAQRPAIEDFNARLPRIVAEAIQARQAVFNEVDDLKQGLEGGL